MNTEEFMKQAKVLETPAGFNGTVKHYSMNTKTLKKTSKEFLERTQSTETSKAWCLGSNAKTTNQKKRRPKFLYPERE